MAIPWQMLLGLVLSSRVESNFSPSKSKNLSMSNYKTPEAIGHSLLELRREHLGHKIYRMADRLAERRNGKKFMDTCSQFTTTQLCASASATNPSWMLFVARQRRRPIHVSSILFAKHLRPASKETGVNTRIEKL